MPEFTGAPAGGPDPSYPQWVFKTHGVLRLWRWEAGPPPVHELQACRTITARALSRHLPASPYSTTTRTLVSVESGLEADLLRCVDRDPHVTWIVPQPLTLVWQGRTRHTPDLLTLDADGAVTVWDVRPLHRQGQRFRQRARMTAEACEHVGWRYEVFSDDNLVRRLNIQWLTHHRVLPAWGESLADSILRQLEDEPRTIDQVVGVGPEDAERLGVVWHLLWAGRITTELDAPLSGASPLALAVPA